MDLSILTWFLYNLILLLHLNISFLFCVTIADMIEWVKANLHTRWSVKLLLFQAFIWMRDNLYSRWSFNILIWHGFRMFLRIILFACFGEFIFEKIDGFYIFFAATLACFLPTHIIIFSPAIIMYYLEKKRGIRIDRKFLDNNKIFIPYFILSIPALIVEFLWIFLAIIGIVAPIPDMLNNLFKANPVVPWFLFISPDFYKVLFLFFI